MASRRDMTEGAAGRAAAATSGDGEDCVSRALSVVETLRAAAGRIEAARALTPDVIAALHEARLFRLMLPREIGGDAAHLKTLAKVMEIIAEADASTGWCLGQAAGCAMAAAYLKPEVMRRMFGPPDAVLAWGAGIAGRAVAVDGGYRVTGKWAFASGCANATLLGGHCYVFNPDGTPRNRADGSQLDRTALFVKSKATVDDMWHTVGLRGTASYTYSVEDLFVPEEETVDRDKDENRVASGDLYVFPTTYAYATAFSALMLGIAHGMVKDLKALAMTKTPRGLSSLMESPVFQGQLAVLEARVRSLRAYLHTTIDEVWDKAVAARELPLGEKAKLKLASTYVITEGVDIATEAYRAAGNTAIFEAQPFERRLRDAHSASQQLQGRPANFVTIGRVMLGLPPDTMVVLG